jgi:hypothetical protein
MKALIELADRLGITLECEALSEVEVGWKTDHDEDDLSDAMPQMKLESWYRRLAFEFVGNEKRLPGEPELSSTMIRRPRAVG